MDEYTKNAQEALRARTRQITENGKTTNRIIPLINPSPERFEERMAEIHELTKPWAKSTKRRATGRNRGDPGGFDRSGEAGD